MINKKNVTGFTLIELMIVLFILGILMAYAIPNYQRFVIRSKRTDAQKLAMKIAGAQERHMTVHGQYATDIVGAESDTNLGFTAASIASDYYNVTLGANIITITAIAGTSQEDDTNIDGDCTSMTINNLGIKTPLACWQ